MRHAPLLLNEVQRQRSEIEALMARVDELARARGRRSEGGDHGAP